MSGARRRAALVEAAPAKLNLYLHVLGRRGDGYHLLDGLVAFADIGDEVRASPAAALTLAGTGPFAAALPADARGNLVWRAAEALAARLGIAPQAALTLVKRLPVASGIGGGSSDAAAALRVLLRLWNGEIEARACAEIAASLGSDVPVCLRPAAAWLGGTGDEVARGPALPETGVVLANPGVPLPTADVYRGFRGPYSEPARFDAAPRDAAELAALVAARRNDLTAAATALVPAIAETLGDLAASEGALVARMSGSGATCFALYRSRDAAAAAARTIASRRPRWWVQAGGVLRS